MSSLPNPSPIGLATPGMRRHGHRRSTAISGDFDAVGLGIYSPQRSKPSGTDEIENFSFNNNEDFAQASSKFTFSFPMMDPEFDNYSYQHPNSSHTPDNFNHHHNNNNNNNNNNTNTNNQHNSNPNSISHASVKNNLNSPIRFGRRTQSLQLGPPPRWEDSPRTSTNQDDQIDLDSVLRAMSIEQRTHDTDIGSPFQYAQHESPFGRNSPLAFQSPAQLSIQPIQELQATEEQLEDDDSPEDPILDDELMFPNPPSSLGLYINDSANSSSSSLRSSSRNAGPSAGFLIEKQFSNDSSGAVNIGASTPGKRSGAKASRYQSFYDQSFKISHALRISSSDSINTHEESSRDRTLGHSSSLPSLKSGGKRMQKPRFHQVRDFSGGNSVATNPNSRRFSPPPRGRSQVSNSPVSMTSDLSSTGISTITYQSTDHSSFHDGQEVSKVSDSTINTSKMDSTSKPLIVISEDNNTPILASTPVMDSIVTPPPATRVDEKIDKTSNSCIRNGRNIPTKIQSRRPMSPQEEKILMQTSIPMYKNNDEESNNVKSTKRNSKIISWFKKK